MPSSATLHHTPNRSAGCPQQSNMVDSHKKHTQMTSLSIRGNKAHSTRGNLVHVQGASRIEGWQLLVHGTHSACSSPVSNKLKTTPSITTIAAAGLVDRTNVDEVSLNVFSTDVSHCKLKPDNQPIIQSTTQQFIPVATACSNSSNSI